MEPNSEDRGRDLVTANNRGGIVHHDVISELDIRGLQQGCFHPRREGHRKSLLLFDKIAWKEPQAQKARRYRTQELVWNRSKNCGGRMGVAPNSANPGFRALSFQTLSWFQLRSGLSLFSSALDIIE